MGKNKTKTTNNGVKLFKSRYYKFSPVSAGVEYISAEFVRLQGLDDTHFHVKGTWYLLSEYNAVSRDL